MIKTDFISNRTAIFHNHLYKISLSSLTELERNLFMYIVSCLKDQHLETIKIPVEKLRAVLNYTGSHFSFKETLKVIEHLRQHFFHTTLTTQGANPFFQDCDNDLVQEWHIFRMFAVDKKTNELYLKIDPVFEYLFNNLNKNFTKIEVKEFMQIQGRYAKDLYQLLSQFRSSGWRQISLEEFRKMMHIPPSYSLKDIERRILKPSMEELQTAHNWIDSTVVRTPFEDLKVEKIKVSGRGQGGRVAEFKFTWTVRTQSEQNQELKEAQCQEPKEAQCQEPKEAQPKKPRTVPEFYQAFHNAKTIEEIDKLQEFLNNFLDNKPEINQQSFALFDELNMAKNRIYGLA